MLVLSRKPGERIRVGPDIKFTIIRISPTSVRVGIEAPQGVDIVREEIEVRWRPTEGALEGQLEHVAGDGEQVSINT